MKLQEAIKTSLDGRIRDKDDVNEICGRLLSLTSSDFGKMYKDVLQYINTAMCDCNLDAERAEEVSYAEYLCLVHEIPNYPTLQDYSLSEKKGFVLFNIDLLITLFSSSLGGNEIIQLFKAITVKSYLEHLCYKVGYGAKDTADVYERFTEFAKNDLHATMNDDVTMGDLMRTINRLYTSHWYPWKGINAYRDNIQNACEGAFDLLIVKLRAAYPELFNFGKLRHKYAVPETGYDKITENNHYKGD